jgi:transketolase
MRNAFAEEITRLASEDPRIVLLSGDIGNRLFTEFRDRFPDRFYNVGVAEADMISIAAGLALGGLKPVTYTIASFSVYRCFEQIRVDLCYHRAGVVIVGGGSGLGYAANGPTHHSCEDIAVLRALPNMTVACPADSWEVRALLRDALQHNGPVYLRIGKKGEPLVHASSPALKLGQAFVLRTGSDLAVLCAGTLLPEVLSAADQLSAAGVSSEVVSCHTVKPLDEATLARVFRDYRLVATVEEHSRIGGLGGAVAEWRADRSEPLARLIRLGTPDTFLHESSDQAHAREVWSLTSDAIASQLLAAWKAAP